MGESSIETIKAVYEDFGRGDVPAVLGAMTADVEWHEAEGMPYGGVHHGPDEIAEKVFGPITQDISDFSVAPEEFFEAGDSVAVVTRYTGRGNVTGKELDLPVVHVWDVRDGKITRFRQFADTVKFLEVVPADATTTA